MRYQFSIAALVMGLVASTSARAVEASRCAVDLTQRAVLAAADPTVGIKDGAAPTNNPGPAPHEPTLKPPGAIPQTAAAKGESLPKFNDFDRAPALKHVSATGATLFDLGERHGLRSIAARVGDQFMILQVAPDGQAVVGGPVLELSKARLTAIAGEQITDMGETHGLRGLFLRNGAEFQVLYETPDHEAMIAGVMWDADGKNLTRDQVKQFDGAIPTVVVNGGVKDLVTPPAGSGMELVQQAASGAYGRDDAPELWMIIDPACSYSIQAAEQLKPFADAGRLRLRIVPISILDHEDNGMSTKAALALLSNPFERMTSAWLQRNFSGPTDPDAAAKLQKNGAIAEAVKLTGTPTFFYRKPDGSEGRLDGMPTNVRALVADIAEHK